MKKAFDNVVVNVVINVNVNVVANLVIIVTLEYGVFESLGSISIREAAKKVLPLMALIT